MADANTIAATPWKPRYNPWIIALTVTLTQGQRNKQYVNGQHWRSRLHLVPFFGNLGISEITAGKIQEYRIHRRQQANAERGKPPGHSTMHQEIVTLRQTLKTALRHGWLDRLPDFSEPYRSSPKSPTGRGSHQRNTRDSTKRHESARRSQRKRASNGNRNNFMTMCSLLQSIPDYGPMKHGALSSGMSRSLTTRIWARQ